MLLPPAQSKGKDVDQEKKKLEELTRERDILTKLRSQVCTLNQYMHTANMLKHV